MLDCWAAAALGPLNFLSEVFYFQQNFYWQWKRPSCQMSFFVCSWVLSSTSSHRSFVFAFDCSGNNWHFLHVLLWSNSPQSSNWTLRPPCGFVISYTSLKFFDWTDTPSFTGANKSLEGPCFILLAQAVILQLSFLPHLRFSYLVLSLSVTSVWTHFRLRNWGILLI